MKKKMNEFSVLSREIAYFLIVYKQRSINGASRQVGLDAGHISRSIGKLEKAVGGQLFVRHKTGLHPTELGERFYHAVSDAQNAFSSKISKSTQDVRRVRIGFHSTVAYSHFSKSMIQALLEQNLQPDFTLAPSVELIDMIKRRELDFVLSHNSVKFPGLVSRTIAT